ncbi:hypothetical protein POVCU2_0044150 [Plasmodium ovale curtisi]|uniref:Uncharacterized protein n=1 Tax=Plasmodium ovale curtisi TaxID=864141 RepID=A0A1A8W6W1_PLAOA|nr:hypothetical protein POVCU2_0044150 [Plasmodium ovale curtisi]
MAAKCRKGEKNPRSAVGALSILCDSSPFHFYDCIKANENGGRCKNRNRDRGRSRRKSKRSRNWLVMGRVQLCKVKLSRIKNKHG